MNAPVQTKRMSKNLTVRQRLEGLRALVRYKDDEKKRHNDRVSESQKEFKDLLKAAAPAADSACRQRLLDLQAKHGLIEERKGERTEFKSKQDEAEYQLLFEDIREGKQVELPGTEVVLTLDSLKHLRLATGATMEADKNRPKDDDEDAPKLPPPSDPKVMADLDAALDGWISESKVSAAALATAGQAEHPDDSKPVGKNATGKKPPVAAGAASPVH
jgi:hypothetical protein